MNFEISPKTMEIHATYDEAVIYCFGLGDGWRLPTLAELQEITTISKNSLNPTTSVLTHVPYHDMANKWHWSSDEYEYNNNKVLCFNYWTNTMWDCDKNNLYIIRPVRDIK